MKSIVAIAVALVVIASVVGWRAFREQTALREVNRQLHERIDALESERAAAAAAAAAKDSVSVVSPELLKLRGEVAQLRRQTNELSKLQQENTQLKSALVAATTAQAQSQPVSPAAEIAGGVDYYPRDRWTFAGYESPENALQSAVWAMSNGDPNRFLASLSPSERAKMEARWKDKTEEQVVAESRREMEKMTGFRVIDRQVVSPDEVVLRVLRDGDEGDVRQMRMKRLGAEWKFDGVTKTRRGGPDATK